MTRTDIINALIERHGYTSYLEIGVDQGDNFRKVNLFDDQKVGVDPIGKCGAIKTTSDEFFRTNTQKFDLIFIDGLHHSTQVLCDIGNALNVLNAGGTIVCHDMNPPDEKHQIVPRQQLGWTGDCWKAWIQLRKECPNLDMKVVDTDYGCGIIQRGSQTPLVIGNDECNWDGFVKNKKSWLNLVSEKDFLVSLQALPQPPIVSMAADQRARVVCLTPTGDRHKQLSLARKWFERSTKTEAVDWMVVDDGVEPFDPGGCVYVRRAPDGPNSLGRQLSFALPLCHAYDEILIWEDDDWYHPDRIVKQVARLRTSQCQLHGWSRSRYYHLGVKGIFQHENKEHASLCETGFRQAFVPKILECIKLNYDNMYYDLKVWRKYGAAFGMLSTDSTPVLGIKGGPGRKGYCPGHSAKRVGYTPKPLSEIIGADAAEYEGWL